MANHRHEPGNIQIAYCGWWQSPKIAPPKKRYGSWNHNVCWHLRWGIDSFPRFLRWCLRGFRNHPQELVWVRFSQQHLPKIPSGLGASNGSFSMWSGLGGSRNTSLACPKLSFSSLFLACFFCWFCSFLLGVCKKQRFLLPYQE